jgi:DNA (cytosine-5)-methyltransferase 1
MVLRLLRDTARMAAAKPRGGRVTVTIGSLCTGYRGLDTAVEHVTGGRTVWHCEIEEPPSLLLAHRFPDVPNHHDLKTLTWADHPVDVLTGGYPCQPFSGAGKRLGTDDPRHLFPWIAQGVAIMRPPLVLLENVRGHLTLGFDVVLAELHRLGYDVRWTLLPASKVGAPHERYRLWIAARAREAGGWPAPTGEPTAHGESGQWLSPQGGLFGGVQAQKPGPAGVMVNGNRWDREVTAAPVFGLMPTPRSTDTNGAGQHGDGGLDLRTAVSLLPTHGALLPTPAATDARGARNSTSGRQEGSQHHSGDTLGDLVHDGRLLPTPAAGVFNDGENVEAWDARRATQAERGINGNGMGEPLTIAVQRLLPTPTTDPQSFNGHARDLGSEARLLSTPVAADGGGARASSAGWGLRDQSRTIAHAWGPYAAAVARWEALTRPAPPPTEGSWVKTRECQDCGAPDWFHHYSVCHGVWRRWALRLSPAFVEWMQGLPAGWVTGVPGPTRNHMLTMLGNGVVPQCAAAAYTLLGISPDLFREVAA